MREAEIIPRQLDPAREGQGIKTALVFAILSSGVSINKGYLEMMKTTVFFGKVQSIDRDKRLKGIWLLSKELIYILLADKTDKNNKNQNIQGLFAKM